MITIFTFISILLINIGVALQAIHIFKTGEYKAINLVSWWMFSICLFILFLFTIIEGQHYLLIGNYGVSASLHFCVTLITTYLFKKDNNA